ncbi:MAG: ABC transporter ATP-binding protein [Actinomycetota bacterium]
MTLVKATGIRKEFGDLVAVDDVDLDLSSGEVVGLLGANGAGKTTFMRILLGLVTPTKGSIELFGEPFSQLTRSRIGYVPQGLGLYEDLTVAENLEFAASAYGVQAPPLGDLAKVGPMLVRDLSLGLRRRASFLNALAHEPELLVLDEPTSGVDVLARSELWGKIRAAAEGGAGVLVSTHHLEEADQCDRVIVMASGRVVLSGTMDAIVGDVSGGLERIDAFEARFEELSAAGR